MKLSSAIYSYLRGHLSNSRDYKGGVLACCPFHSEKTPSFFVYYDWKHKNQWWFKCHGCEQTGSLNTLLRRLKGFHLIEAESYRRKGETNATAERLQLFDDTHGFPEDFAYYSRRGIKKEVVRRFGFRFDYYGPAAIMPVYTEDEYCGYVRRNLDPSMPRYFLSEGMDLARVLWGLDACDYGQTTFITEGILDAASLVSIGYQAVSLVVKGSYEHKLELLSKLEKPVLVPDNDLSGIKTFTNVSKIINAPMFYVPTIFKDVNEWVVSGTFSCNISV